MLIIMYNMHCRIVRDRVMKELEVMHECVKLGGSLNLLEPQLIHLKNCQISTAEGQVAIF